MARKREQMDDEDLVRVTTELINEAYHYVTSKISTQRAKSLRYYDGECDIPPIEGRSEVVSTDVRDTIEWIMPSLMRIFMSGDDAVAVEGHGEEDIEPAKMAEEWANYVIHRENRGFEVVEDWFKDALLQKNGYVHSYWRTYKEVEEEHYEGLSNDELGELRADPDFEVDEVENFQDVAVGMMPGAESMDPPQEELVDLHNVSGLRTKEHNKICLDVVPPEDVLTLDRAKNLREGCDFVCVRSLVSISQIREMGFDVEDDIQAGPLAAERHTWDEETQERYSDSAYPPTFDDDQTTRSRADPSMRLVYLYQSYTRVDLDGDGLSEWWLITQVGRTILEKQRVRYPMLSSLCPIRRTHRHIGYSYADIVFELQDMKTSLQRQILDFIYQTNNPRWEVDTSKATEDTIDDLLDTRLGSVIRTRGERAVMPHRPPSLDQWVFALLEYTETLKENRTGVTRYNQGLDANTLNKTATGIQQIMSAAQQRIELIARRFAETGFRDLVQCILHLTVDYPDMMGERMVRLTGKPMILTSDHLRGNYDLVVNTGIGTGSKEQQLAHLQSLLEGYDWLMQRGLGPGQQVQVVTIENIYNTFAKMVENMGFKNTADHITDPAEALEQLQQMMAQGGGAPPAQGQQPGQPAQEDGAPEQAMPQQVVGGY